MKTLATIILICLSSMTGVAQTSSAYKTQVETIFQVDRSFVTTGLLQDYGILFTNVGKYTGIRSDSSFLDYSEWQSIYNSLYTCRSTTTATLATKTIK